MISTILVALLFVWAVRGRHGFVAAVFLPTMYFYYLAYELRSAAFTKAYFDFAVVRDYTPYLAFGFVFTISLLLAFSPIFRLRHPVGRHAGRKPDYDPKMATRAYYVLSALSLVAFTANIIRIKFDFSLLVLAPRAYEELFGRYTIINYIYFLNIPALCLSIFQKQKGFKIKGSLAINILLVLISFFHGIKFTVFDTLLLPAFLYYHGSGNQRRALSILGITMSILLSFYLAFSFLVRGASGGVTLVESVLNYILPNYYNFAYAIEHQTLQFDLVSFLVPDKIPNPFSALSIGGTYGFSLNESFNMGTAFSVYYGIFPVLSWILAMPLLVWVRLRIQDRKQSFPSIANVFTCAYFDFCLFFSWYFYAFNKTKYVYLLMVLGGISWFVHRKPFGGRLGPSQRRCQEGGALGSEFVVKREYWL